MSRRSDVNEPSSLRATMRTPTVRPRLTSGIRQWPFKSSATTNRSPELTFHKGDSLLPSTGQGFVEFHEDQQFVELGRRQCKFGGEIVGFICEDFEVTGNTTAVPHVRETRCVLCGGNQEFLLLAKLLCLAVSNQ